MMKIKSSGKTFSAGIAKAMKDAADDNWRKERMSRKDYYMELAKVTAYRATCLRAKVGAVAVKNNTVIMTAYNGSPPRTEHCIDAGCLIEHGHCIRTIHAEANLVAHCAKEGISLDGSDVYITLHPCNNCLKLLISAGVQRVIYETAYVGTKYFSEYEDLIEIYHINEVPNE